MSELSEASRCELAWLAPPLAVEDHVVIDVHAAGVTWADLALTRGEGMSRPELPFVPGFELAGTIRSASRGSGFVVGQRVAGLTWTGAYAEQVSLPASQVAPVPDDISLEAAASLIVDHHTAFLALSRYAHLLPGETLLVHESAGRLDVATIQVGRALGARVMATARSEETVRIAAEVGADEVLDRRGAWADHVAWLTDGRGVDILLDPAGGQFVDDSMRCLAPGGRLLVAGRAGERLPALVGAGIRPLTHS